MQCLMQGGNSLLFFICQYLDKYLGSTPICQFLTQTNLKSIHKLKRPISKRYKLFQDETKWLKGWALGRHGPQLFSCSVLFVWLVPINRTPGLWKPAESGLGNQTRSLILKANYIMPFKSVCKKNHHFLQKMTFLHLSFSLTRCNLTFTYERRKMIHFCICLTARHVLSSLSALTSR